MKFLLSDEEASRSEDARSTCVFMLVGKDVGRWRDKIGNKMGWKVRGRRMSNC